MCVLVCVYVRVCACVCVCVCACACVRVYVVNLSNLTKNELTCSHKTIQSSIANKQSIIHSVHNGSTSVYCGAHTTCTRSVVVFANHTPSSVCVWVYKLLISNTNQFLSQESTTRAHG